MVPPSFIPAVVAAKMHKFVYRFENAGATNPTGAKTLQSQGLHGGLIFNRLLRNGIFIETLPGFYYLNKDKYLTYMTMRRKRMLYILAGLLLVVVIVTLFLL
jgi:hypothetical protein